MLGISKKIESASQVDDQLVLPFDRRQKSRLRVVLASGIEAALLLERGTVLRGGDLLQAEDGRVVQVVAADEPVLLVTAETAQQLMRAAYHLGNRHVPLEVCNGWLRLEQDHVLQEMLLGLGVQVEGQMAPFEPEAGAYGGGHRHHHDDDAPSIRQPTRLRGHE
ncbi:urease accessory protein UreE [Methylobacillus flagellatus]|uniref:urease accessory protein UreE n=1 Tax=Methylobacillus flagellatus TaxID=405 RepID=UPI0028540AE7|nr:urease accessory protein UreE [Methylobacillus flagellatus]MDR5171742.1 urease accessory protein UreE [Methylobacillus flagellatus]